MAEDEIVAPVEGDPQADDKAAEPKEEPKAKEPTPEEMRAEIERLRAAQAKNNKENEGNRKKLKEYEKAEKERADALKTEQERRDEEHKAVSAKAETLEKELRSVKVSHAIELTALAMDFHDSEDALRPEVISAVEFDENGAIDMKSVRAAVKKLAESKPHLVDKSGEADAKNKNRSNGMPLPGSKVAPKPGNQPAPQTHRLVR